MSEKSRFVIVMLLVSTSLFADETILIRLELVTFCPSFHHCMLGIGDPLAWHTSVELCPTIPIPLTGLIKTAGGTGVNRGQTSYQQTVVTSCTLDFQVCSGCLGTVQVGDCTSIVSCVSHDNIVDG